MYIRHNIGSGKKLPTSLFPLHFFSYLCTHKKPHSLWNFRIWIIIYYLYANHLGAPRRTVFMKDRIVTFGELLLRFSKYDKLRLQQGNVFQGNFGGSEANVAISLAVMGNDTDYVTRMPDNQMGHAGCMKLQQLGVGTSHVLFGGDRLGTYYYEEAAGMRSSKVVYDRDNSSFFTLEPQMFNWKEILQGATIFHASGITGAISQTSADATFEALRTADEMGLTISFDINHRKNLWKYGADPRTTLGQMLQYADIVFADAIEFEFITGRRVPFTATSSAYVMPLDVYREWFDDIHRRFPRCRRWLMGMRNMMSSSHNTLTALVWDHGELYHTRIYDIQGIVDAMGVGDAFTAGMIHAELNFPADVQQCLDYSLAAAVLKYSIPGDFNLSTEDEIRQLMESELICQ